MATGNDNRMKRIYTTARTGDIFEPTNYNLVEELRGLTLENSIEMLHCLPKKLCHASVILFHQVHPTTKKDLELDIDWSFIQNEMRHTSITQSLTILKKNLLYRQSNVSGQLTDSHEVFNDRDMPQYREPLMEDAGSCVLETSVAHNYVENVMRQITTPGRNTLYFNNSEWIPRGYRNLLQDIPSHLSPNVNDRLGESPGINTPMFYVGTSESYTAMHVEDGLADSLNILHDGHPKFWVVVDSKHYIHLNKCLSKSLQTLEPDQNRFCPFPLHHKDLFISPRYLDENNINYKLLVQKPGDLIYIRQRVPHQVINVGKNIAEATNYGSHEWNISNDGHAFCTCGRSKVQSLKTNTSASWCIGKPINIALFSCELCGNASFVSTKELMKHKMEIHAGRFECPDCTVKFKYDSGLRRHQQLRHGASLRGKQTTVAIPEEAV